VNLPELNWPYANGASTCPPRLRWQVPDRRLSTTVDGIVFTSCLVCAIHPKLPWRDTVFGNTPRPGRIRVDPGPGQPLLHGAADLRPGPGFDAGVFSVNRGWKFILGVFLWHLAYGLHVGLVYNPLPKVFKRTS